MGIEYVVSYGSTRHIVGTPSGFSDKMHAGRITTLCGMGLRYDEGPFAAKRDCSFCREERMIQEERAAAAVGAECLTPNTN